jgi:CRISPR/Cas system CMR subunit Cmr4 (Cas7 group RAMP superfamily)
MSFGYPEGNRQFHSSHNFTDKRLMFIPGFSTMVALIWLNCSLPITGLDDIIMPPS